MGRRHLRGFATLAQVRPGLVELAAVVDVAEERAAFLAGEAEELLGRRPAVFQTLEAAARGTPDLEAVDIVTVASTHHVLAPQALELGLHVLVEKPVAVTVRGGRRVIDTARRTGKLVSVAENYRRDPMARLARALIDARAVGVPRSVLDLHFGGGDRLLITPWRHMREEGGPILDVGVHNADLLLYLLGPLRRVSGQARLSEPERLVPQGAASPGGFYERFRGDFPAVVQATAPDILMMHLEFASGVWGELVLDMAAHGAGSATHVVYGNDGRLDLPGMRRGLPLSVWPDGAPEPLGDAAILERVPQFQLEPLVAELFGGPRLARYDRDFPAADRNLLATEIEELARSIETGTPVEVGPAEGLAAVAVILAGLESAEAGRPVALEQVLDGTVNAYQADIDRTLGLRA